MHKTRSLTNSLFLIPILLLISFSLHADHVIFIIHGTWASTAEWASADGDFFKAIEQSAQQSLELRDTQNRERALSFLPDCLKKGYHEPEKIHVVPFTWSGKKKHIQREQAAKNLVKLIQSYPADTQFTLVAHSHGVNVSLLASNYLAQEAADKQRTISTLYALGGPIQEERYAPNMNIIGHLYNLFSFGDIVQPVFNKWHRVFNPHERIANLEVTIEGQEPEHSQMHDPIIGAALVTLDQKLRSAHADTLFCEPGSLEFSAQTPDPIYTAKTYEDRTRKLENDLTQVKRRWLTFLATKAKNAFIAPQGSDTDSGADSDDANAGKGQVMTVQQSASWIPAFAQRFRWSASPVSRPNSSFEHESKEEKES